MAGIRVIAGKAKGRRLKMVPGQGTRPVPDRVKEAVFNILGAGVEGAAFWDMFAGTGSVGIEALSRGAAFAYFTDKDSRAIDTVRENLAITKLGECASTERGDAFNLLSAPARKQFDFVYVAPPQYKEMWKRSVHALDANLSWLYPDAWVIVQIDPREDEPLVLENLERFDERTYGSTKVLFFEWAGE